MLLLYLQYAVFWREKEVCVGLASQKDQAAMATTTLLFGGFQRHIQSPYRKST